MSTSSFCPKRAAVVDALAAKYGLSVKKRNRLLSRLHVGPGRRNISLTFFQPVKAGMTLRGQV